MADDYFGLGDDFATPADLTNSGFSGAVFSGTPDASLNYGSPNFSPDNYTYATPEELTASGFSAPNSGIGYATPAELTASGYTAPMSGQGATGSYAPSASSSSGLAKLIDAAKQALTSKASTGGGLSDIALALARLYGAANPSFMNPQAAGGYHGSVPQYTAMRQQLAQAPYKAYSGSSEPVMGRQSFTPTTYAAEGGIMGLAHGGQAKDPRYLDGPTDGMADKIDTDIDGKQAAKLSHGEFVIPADVVSHLGNGNSKAGADALYKSTQKNLPRAVLLGMLMVVQ
jgi:hypothetical protein